MSKFVKLKGKNESTGEIYELVINPSCIQYAYSENGVTAISLLNSKKVIDESIDELLKILSGSE